MRPESWHFAFLVFPALVVLHLWVSPYTKVEESFNVQATHDILTYGVPSEKIDLKFQKYDHTKFPGAVPRTFIGALALSGIANPFVQYFKLELPQQQFLVRAILGLLNATAFVYYTYGVRRAFGKSVALWYFLLQASQFHVFYYASRTLPNMFAFGLTTVAMRFYLPDPTSRLSPVKRTRLAIYLTSITTIIFRAELALILASQCLYLFVAADFQTQACIRILRTTIIPPIIAASVAGLILTISIDTYFWRQSLSPSDWLWPELSAFLSNIFPHQGAGASDWGTSPFLWYFTSAVPRLFINPFIVILLLASLTMPNLRPNDRSLPMLLQPYLLYTLLYSFLPHKETRFIFPIIQPITTALALSASYISDRRARSLTNKLITYTLLISTLLTALLSHTVLLPLSALTYPGAHALNSVHSISTIYPPQRQIDVHLCNLALQTGVTLFQQHPLPRSPLVVLPGSADGRRKELRSGGTKWVYDKSDNSTGAYAEEGFWRQFDYVVVESVSDVRPERGWDVVDTVFSLGRPVLVGKHVGRGLLVLGDERDPVPPAMGGEGVRRYPDGISRVLEAEYGDSLLGRVVVWVYGVVHDVLREGYGIGGVSLTGGKWVHWNMERSLYVLKRGEGMGPVERGPGANRLFVD